jgi:hypothetical protein
MAFIVAGLMRDAHQARGAIRALGDTGFEIEDMDMAGGPLGALMECGIPEGDAHVFAEGVRRGGAIVAVKADDEMEAEQAALIMNQHGACDIDACATGWRSQGWGGRIAEPAHAAYIEGYAYVFGDYPAGAGMIYQDARQYQGPERRRTDKPYAGANRRAV